MRGESKLAMGFRAFTDKIEISFQKERRCELPTNPTLLLSVGSAYSEDYSLYREIQPNSPSYHLSALSHIHSAAFFHFFSYYENSTVSS